MNIYVCIGRQCGRVGRAGAGHALRDQHPGAEQVRHRGLPQGAAHRADRLRLRSGRLHRQPAAAAAALRQQRLSAHHHTHHLRQRHSLHALQRRLYHVPHPKAQNQRRLW